MLGIPFPNGLIPQAPFHTASLCATTQRRVPVLHNDPAAVEVDKACTIERATDHVVEQRVSNLLQGSLCLVVMTGPLLVVIGLIPQAVLAGLFFTMGAQALASNGITRKLTFLCADRALSAGDPLGRLQRRGAIWAFVALQLAFFGAAIAVTQTVAAIGFPIVLLAPIPFRAVVMPRLFQLEELEVLDAPTASPFTMESVAGSYRRGDGLSGSSGPGDNDGSGSGHEEQREKQDEEAAGASTTGRSLGEKRFEGGGDDDSRFKGEGWHLGGDRAQQRSSTIDSRADPWKL